jgi:hypothetical protein
MGFSYRKTIKAGPFRITAYKSGVSYSAGVKGARVTKRAILSLAFAASLATW